jgi:hypothetical protein
MMDHPATAAQYDRVMRSAPGRNPPGPQGPARKEGKPMLRARETRRLVIAAAALLATAGAARAAWPERPVRLVVP